jgi:hydrogenase maturation protease
MIVGYDYLIVVDSILSGRQPGEILHLTPDDFQIGTESFVSQHKIGVIEAIELGRSLGIIKLTRVDIVAIEVKDITDFGEYLTPEIAAAVPVAVKCVLELLAPVLTQV